MVALIIKMKGELVIVATPFKIHHVRWGVFPGGRVTKILPSQCRGQGLIPGQGTRSHMPQVKDLLWHI